MADTASEPASEPAAEPASEPAAEASAADEQPVPNSATPEKRTAKKEPTPRQRAVLWVMREFKPLSVRSRWHHCRCSPVLWGHGEIRKPRYSHPVL